MLSICLLFCFVIFWILCYVMCEKKKKKNVDTKKDLLNNSLCVCVYIRSRSVQQHWLLREALALLHSSRGEMTTVKNQLTHFLETWENSKALIQQSCISADAGNYTHAHTCTQNSVLLQKTFAPIWFVHLLQLIVHVCMCMCITQVLRQNHRAHSYTLRMTVIIYLVMVWN